MAQVAQLIGPAGTGKTTELLRLMDMALERDVHDPHLVGFCSFTRAARREASSRAADRYGMKPADLEETGWFKTIHAICYRCLGIGKELLAGNKADKEWLQDVLQESVDGKPISSDGDLAEPFAGNESDAGKALAIWETARNRLMSFDEAWRIADEFSDQTPDLEFCRSIVTRYEQAKRLDCRCDFTDILARFSGWRCTMDGAERCSPEGEAPDLPVWMFDETQDASALIHEVSLRLTQQPSVRYVYVAGDDAQAIYGWNGGDPRWLRDGWPMCKRRILQKSYRCTREIINLAEGLLLECSDNRYYADRNVVGADHEGAIEQLSLDDGLADLVDPRDSWLLLARSNLLASKMARMLDEHDIPWLPTRGNGTWNAPVRGEAIAALMNLQRGSPIDGREWRSILKYVPSKSPDGQLIEHGAKKRFDDMTQDMAQDAYPWESIDELTDLGATQLCIEHIKAGKWRLWIDGAERYEAAVETYGKDAVDNPGILVGTVHSSKGSEADNVAVLTTIPATCFRAAQSPEGFDEETRVKYVAATRARRRLVILDERRQKFRWRIDT